ncbi:MAG: signal peptidase I [Candidatus Dasytiphilus stammeri]
MVSTFTLILTILTFSTGIIWLIRIFSIQLIAKNSLELIIYKALETAASIFPMLLLVFIIRSFIYEPFQISSGSMMPTLLAGDFIMVEKFSYDIKNPLTKTIWIPINKPKRGDIVVFHYPLNPKLNYIKRIIGIPGDKISYNYIKKEINIQPICKKDSNCNKPVAITYSNMKLSNFIQTFQVKSGWVESDFSQITNNFWSKYGIRLFEKDEIISNIHHRILLSPTYNNITNNVNLYYQQFNQPLATWLVPKDYYFMMGDNRDYSSDSRYWGFVPKKNLVGKAVLIWMSFSIKPDSNIPIGIRLNRIGRI